MEGAPDLSVVRLVPEHHHLDGDQGEMLLDGKKRKLNHMVGGSVSHMSLNSHHDMMKRRLQVNNDHLQPGERGFHCKFCDYRCSRKDNMAAHMRKHTGEKPYTCDECNYRTARKSSLTVHIRTHTGEKPFRCLTCNTRFSTKSHLNRHRRIHTGEKPFTCELCDFSSATKSHLTRHMLKHTGEKPFVCTVCDFRCSRNSNMKRHMATHEANQNRNASNKKSRSEKARINALVKTVKEKTQSVDKLLAKVEAKRKIEVLLRARIDTMEHEMEKIVEEKESLMATNELLLNLIKDHGIGTDLLGSLPRGKLPT